MNKLITEKELMEKLKLSRSSIVRLRKQGLPFKKINRSIRYDEEEVSIWLQRNQN